MSTTPVLAALILAAAAFADPGAGPRRTFVSQVETSTVREVVGAETCSATLVRTFVRQQEFLCSRYVTFCAVAGDPGSCYDTGVCNTGTWLTIDAWVEESLHGPRVCAPAEALRVAGAPAR